MLEQILLHHKQFSLKLREEPLKIRLEYLSDLEKMVMDHTEDIVQALRLDFAKPEAEALLTEIYPVLHEIRYVKKNLKKWIKPQRVSAPLGLMGTKNYILPVPRGVCLIIGPWNYPFQLMIAPLIAALAAGNCAFLKPSEFTPHTSALLKVLIKKTFSEDHVTVIEGGVEMTQNLLELPFDHIFFTGSTQVGKVVMAAASKHLSSITLELGGKSPTVIDSTADLEQAAEKITWAKFVNAGQTCVAPDYLLIHKDVFSEFRSHLIKKIETFYGKSDHQKKNSPDLARIISVKHTERLAQLLKEAVKQNAEITYGGDIDIPHRYVAPTLIEKVDMHSALMKEEIFGPLLPMIPFHEISEVLHFINDRPKPLALYIYSHSEMNIEALTKGTASGGVCINDSVIHVGNVHLPFGGIGESGLGNYHGYFGFRAFSHEKSVLRQYWLGRLLRVIYPPYTAFKINLIKKLIRWHL
ncbi:MAG: aldehyde dehydrogenase family protein [Bdellovibrio sp.]|nr:aldehyde dehydrogenase family protein [Bdellovibrio sp.]